MRAAFAALAVGVVGGLGLATAVLSGVRPATTIEGALALEGGPGLDARRAAAVAASVTACMERLGLDWQPVPEPIPSVPDADLDPVAWADRWGFGVSTTAEAPIPSSTPDPNLQALERLTPADRTAARAALHGSSRQPGCLEAASAAVYQDRERALAPLRTALADLEASIEADPATVRGVATWRGCVAGVSGGATLERATLGPALLRRAPLPGPPSRDWPPRLPPPTGCRSGPGRRPL